MIEVLTALRALAVLAIFLHHVAYFSGFATIAVSLFFTLSGFVLAYKYNKTFSTLNKQELAHFFRLRLAKIYPLHIVTFLISIQLF